jgi:dCTP deaminase
VILSNVEIHQALDDGRLVITPEPTPRRTSIQHPQSPYNTTAIDLRLAPRISIPREGAYMYDLRRGGIADVLAANSDHKELDEGGYIMGPNRFILGQTLEHIGLPLDRGEPVLAARIEGRSSVARCGVLVHFTAPTVHAGWSGPLTLEMRNLGPVGFPLFPGMPICQLIIEQVVGMPIENPSQFQNQTKPSGTR